MIKLKLYILNLFLYRSLLLLSFYICNLWGKKVLNDAIFNGSHSKVTIQQDNRQFESESNFYIFLYPSLAYKGPGLSVSTEKQNIYYLKKKKIERNLQMLRNRLQGLSSWPRAWEDCTSNVGGMGLIPGWGSKILYVAQSKHLKKKKGKKLTLVIVETKSVT